MKKRIIGLVLVIAMCLGTAMPATAALRTEVIVSEGEDLLSISNVSSVTDRIAENDYFWFEEIPGVEIFGDDTWWINNPEVWYWFIGIYVDGERDISNRIDDVFVPRTYTVAGSTTITLVGDAVWAQLNGFRVDAADAAYSSHIVNEVEIEPRQTDWHENGVIDALTTGSQIHINGPGVYMLRLVGLPGPEQAYVIIVENSSTDQPAALPPQPQTVNPTQSTVFVNGEERSFEAYNIDGSNFFKLRDLAYVLNGTDKQFSVGYDGATRAITLTSGQPYTPDGSELMFGDGLSKSATLNSSINISLDGVPVDITAYLIGGNNFMRLRDVMSLLDISVGYDNATRNITIDT